ncbi:hypothetical protein Cni_G14529 [Canna indica]|uniref:Uncharacterized protein n=1 Tax=Canna indica TaxID=4628 RepID=A0AAQ3KF92_9LILI|nr:hypothetical protein Cni_G14529 [Canna indica]
MGEHVDSQSAPAVPCLLLLPPPPPSKSNLKKPNRPGDQQQAAKDGKRRRVTWPDAHGRDLAHVQVFHSRNREVLCLHNSVKKLIAHQPYKRTVLEMGDPEASETQTPESS